MIRNLLLILVFVSLKSLALSHHLEHFSDQLVTQDCYLCVQADTQSDLGVNSSLAFLPFEVATFCSPKPLYLVYRPAVYAPWLSRAPPLFY